MKVAIVGGGIMGVSLGYYLAREGVQVEIFEASPSLGGLAGQISLEDGTQVDRFYHAILSSDAHVRGLCAELGIADRLRFSETRSGFYHQGNIHAMNGTLDFLRFPPLGWVDRFRLGLTVLAAQMVKDWRQLESVSVEQWLLRWGGRQAYEQLWRPMLRAKFDDGFDAVPATYIWSRLVRMKSARRGASQKELVGHLIGGHILLVEAMAQRIEEEGGEIHLRSPIDEILIEGGRAWGLRRGSRAYIFDAVICTLQAPIFARLIPDADPAYLQTLDKTEYLGIVSALLVLDRPLSGNWTINITDERFPFTGVIETTTYIDPAHVGGHHLVYLPKYLLPGSSWARMPDDEIRAIWLRELQAMFPLFDQSWIRYFLVHRERYVEPLHRLNGTDEIPGVNTSIEGLYLATTAQIYPGLTNAESLSRHAADVAQAILAGRAQSIPMTAEQLAPELARERVPA